MREGGASSEELAVREGGREEPAVRREAPAVREGGASSEGGRS